MSMKIVGPSNNRKFYNVSTSDLSNYGGGYVYVRTKQNSFTFYAALTCTCEFVK